MKISALLMQTVVAAGIVSYRNNIPGIIVTSFGFFSCYASFFSGQLVKVRTQMQCNITSSLE